jgi:hypothetical protein
MSIGGSNHEGYGGEIEQVLIAYLQSHPHAADTLDGIVAWWLPLQRYEIGRTRIAGVLSAMVEAGTLRREVLPDGDALYALPTANEHSGHLRN